MHLVILIVVEALVVLARVRVQRLLENHLADVTPTRQLDEHLTVYGGQVVSNERQLFSIVVHVDEAFEQPVAFLFELGKTSIQIDNSENSMNLRK